MAGLGDRAVAALLSALAEAPDFPAAASFLLTQVAELTGATRACMWRLDPAEEAIAVVASSGFTPELPPIGFGLGDLSNPLVISTLAAIPVTGIGGLGPRALADFATWYALPLTQPRYRGAPELMPTQRGRELI